MYSLVDRPVALLGPQDRFLLDAMRAWVHALTLTGDPRIAMAGGFAERGGPQQQAVFDAAMQALDRGSVETLTFQRPCHSTVEEDEAVVLALWHLVQRDRLSDAVAAAARLVSANEARALVRAMVAFGASQD